MFPAAASSAPEHARASGPLQSRPVLFLLFCRYNLWTARGILLCLFFLSGGLKWKAGPIITGAKRNCDGREWATCHRAEEIRRHRNNTALPEVGCTCRGLRVRITLVEHAWGAEAERHLKLDFLGRVPRKFSKWCYPASAERAGDWPWWAHGLGRNVACRAKIQGTPHT